MPTVGENKIKPGSASVVRFLSAIPDPQKREDATLLAESMGRITGEPAVMWGDSMVGFGRYHYRYESGREGDSFLVGFSPRKSEFSIYLTGAYLPEEAEESAALLKQLGRHRMGKACLYVKRLADVDMVLLEQLIGRAVAALKARYGAS